MIGQSMGVMATLPLRKDREERNDHPEIESAEVLVFPPASSIDA